MFNAQNIKAPGGVFNHVLGNQYNITTSHATALHLLPSSHHLASDDDYVSVPINFSYLDGSQPATSRVVLLAAKIKLGSLTWRGNDFNQAIRNKLGEWYCCRITSSYSYLSAFSLCFITAKISL